MVDTRLRFETDEPTLEILCRRHDYSTIINQRPYCTVKGDCIYRDEKVDKYLNKYRCMNIEKRC